MAYIIINRNTLESLTDRDTWMASTEGARRFRSMDEASYRLLEMFGEDRGWGQGIRITRA